MPIYEFRCQQCGKKSEIITFRVSEEITPSCKHCGCENVNKVPSRVRVRLSEETRLERLADPSRLRGLDENDPKSMAGFLKSMGREMGDELGEDMDVDALVEEAMDGGVSAESESMASDDI